MSKEIQQVKVILGRFQPFTLGHLKLATYSDLKGPNEEQSKSLREQPDLKEISKQKTIILVVSTPPEKVDSKHPFVDDLMKKEFEIIKKSYNEIEDVLYVKSADICAWGELLKEKGYQASVWITGSDEFPRYVPMAIKVPEYEEHNRDNRDCKDAYTKSFYIEEVTRNDESSDFTETISGTKVRESLKNDDKETFKKMMPKGTDVLFDEFKEAVLNAPEPVKKSKKVKESKLYDYILNRQIDITNYLTEKLHIDKNIKYDPETVNDKVAYVKELAKEKGLEVRFRDKEIPSGDFAFFIYDKSVKSSYLVGYDGYWKGSEATFDKCYEMTVNYIEKYKK